MALVTLRDFRSETYRLLNVNPDYDGYDVFPLADVDRALEVALDACVNEYVAHGGDALVQTAELSAVAGVVDISSLNAVKVVSVLLKEGNVYSRMESITLGQTYSPWDTNQTIKVVYVARPSIPSSADDVVDYGPTQWPTFSQWICLKAALQLETQDSQGMMLSPGLSRQEALTRQSVLNSNSGPKVNKFPNRRPRAWNSQRFINAYGMETYSYIETPGQLELVFG